jgi:Rad52/22 family double-strand break repair protein
MVGKAITSQGRAALASLENGSSEQQSDAPVVLNLYRRLAAPFDSTFKDVRGGVELEYITGEQCISRLNETLGVGGWSFLIREHGVHAEADEVWVLGEITASIEGVAVVRQQFGSQKLRRARSNGTPVDIGFDLKVAATDALKKCASLLGVGLYLSKKEIPAVSGAPASPSVEGSEAPTCVECGVELKETRFRDGTVWGPEQLAGYGRRKHDRVLCMEHYRLANEARRRAERVLEDVPA